MAKFLSALCVEIAYHVLGLVFGSKTVPSVPSTFGQVLRISTRTPSLLDQSAMVSSTHGRGRGHGRERNLGGGRTVRKCDHYSRLNHTSDKCWDKFGRPE